MPIQTLRSKFNPVKGIVMRRTSTLLGLGAALLATPAFAHIGDHGNQNVVHFLADHGVAAGLIALSVLAVSVYLIRRKG